MDIRAILADYTPASALEVRVGSHVFRFDPPEDLNRFRVAQREATRFAQTQKKLDSGTVEECFLLSKYSLDGLTWSDFMEMAKSASGWYLACTQTFLMGVPVPSSLPGIIHEIEEDALEQAGNESKTSDTETS